VRDQRSALPLPRDLGKALVVLSPVSTGRTLMERWTSGASILGESIAAFAPGLTEVPMEYPLAQPAQRDLEQAIAGARVVVLGTLNAILDPDQVRVAEVVRERAPDALLVVVALRTPYDVLPMPWVDAFVCAYTSVEPSMVALAEVLFGETPASGRLPVELPGLYPRGHGRVHPRPSG
jgi:beta-N-acetylhexosaminidase